MAATTLNLPYARFVAQVSTGAPRPKSSFLALMAENLEALQACPWREASDAPVSLTPHDFTAPSYLSDAFDAYKMTGGWNSDTQTETAFAGMAAYRFKIPSAAASVSISAVTLPLSRDRFLKGGVRVVAVLGNNATPSDDWDTIRGNNIAPVLVNEAEVLVASQPAEIERVFASSSLPELAATGKTYLWIYITLEDYTDWWDKYTGTEARQYAIEGSAMLVGGSVSVTFAGDVAPDGLAASLPVVLNGALPRLMGEASGIFSTVRCANGDGLDFEDSWPSVNAWGGMGLHAIYADLLLDRLQAVPASAVPGTARPGVGFSISRGTLPVPSGTLGTEVGVAAWRLALSVLVVPFVRPGGKAAQLSLGWTVPDPADGTIRAYLAAGKYIEQPVAADLSAPAFFMGDDNLPEGWQPLGEFAASAGSATLALPAPPPVPQLATLLLAAWLPQASVDPSSSAVQGVGALAYDPFTGELSGLTSLIVPTISLV